MSNATQGELAFGVATAPATASSSHLTDWQPDAWPLAPGWHTFVEEFIGSPAGQKLGRFITGRIAAGARIYPPQPLRALALTPLERVRVVILGQDPYHGAGQAEGLAFSVPQGVKPPPSLRNIFKELAREGFTTSSADGSLAGWATQGVLLLNTCLTVEDGLPASHARQGWEILTDALLAAVATQAPACVYLLWGAHAQAKAPLIESMAASRGHEALLLLANHPSPLSALRPPVPFIGCGHFAAAKRWLAERHIDIDWSEAAASTAK